MDRGRGRGRASNKTRRTQSSPHSGTQPEISERPSSTFNTSTPPPPRYLSPDQASPHSTSSHNMDRATNSLTPRSERPVRISNLHHSFSLETPSGPSSAGYSTRKRTKSFAMGYDGAVDDHPVEKGGHTLRKRSRVDYTQELVDDNHLSNETKPDNSKKPAYIQAAQGRKRRATQDLSGDETDSVSVTQKKRRLHLEKENTAPRSTPTRRRKEGSRQAAASVQPSVEHPSSDNEVQDTILVGGLMENTTSSSSQAESSESPVLPRSLPQLVTRASSPNLPASEAEVSRISAPEIQTDTEQSTEEHSAMKQEPRADTHRDEIGTSQFIKSEDQERPAWNSKNEGETPETHTSANHSQSLEPQVRGPKRLPQLNQIYENAQHQVYRSPIAPYEDDDVIHPASWTEQVYPQATPNNGISTPAPTLTPRSSPPPKEPPYIADTWDPTDPITLKQFYSLYHQDSLRRRSKGQARISLQEFRLACARRHKEALANPKPEPEPEPEPEAAKKPTKSKARAKGRAKAKRGRSPEPESPADADSPAALDAQLQQVVAASTEGTPRASPVPESQPATAAPSPEPEAEADKHQDIDQDIDGEVVESEIENGPVGPEIVTRHPRKQYLFKKLPDVGPMEEALEDPEEADDKTLYQTLESGANTLKAWQDEYLELKKITDDEDNAKRRAQNDKAIENWDSKQKLDDVPAFRRTFDEAIQKAPAPFDVKGVRAPKPYIDDPVQEHQRQEDRIMAQAYGFDYKGDKSSIGKQDPIAQRWETSENRLRDRRQTQKAADAVEDGVILEGKRTRKPRVLEDHSAPASRAATPVPAPRQRQRRTVTIAATEDFQPAVAEPPVEPVTRKRGPRGKAKDAVPEEAPQAEVKQNVTSDETPHEEQPKATRKRGRTTGPHPLATTTYAEPQEELPVMEEPEPAAKRQRKTKEAASNGPEIPVKSFYSQQSADEPRRPSTSSSSGTANTVATVESSYSLREKKKRNFAAENDPIAESRPKRAKPIAAPPTSEEKTQEQPAKKKRVRNRKKAHVAAETPAAAPPRPAAAATASPVPPPGMMMHTFSANPDTLPAPHLAKRALPKIKIINGYNGHPAPVPAPPVGLPSAAASPAHTPSPIVQPRTNPGSLSGSAEPPEKPYSEMSKSEKMSYSMRRRWAAGEMQGAVEKRKNTLARKAEAKATAPPPVLTPKPLQPAAGPLAPASSAVGGRRPSQFMFQEGYLPSPHAKGLPPTPPLQQPQTGRM